jgi:hypothetical protein
MGKVKLTDKELSQMKKIYCGNFKRYFYFIGSVGLFGITILNLIIFIYLTSSQLLSPPNITIELLKIFATGLMTSVFYLSYLLNKVITHYESEKGTISKETT